MIVYANILNGIEIDLLFCSEGCYYYILISLMAELDRIMVVEGKYTYKIVNKKFCKN